MKKAKKAQAWGFDLMVAAIIFMFGVFAFYLYSINQGDSEEIINSLSSDGKLVASFILSEGFPEDWSLTNVAKIGILTGSRINETKLESFFTLSAADYNKAKSLLNTKYNYYFFLDENLTIAGNQVEGIGLKPTSSQNLIKTTRFTIYKEKPVTAYLYTWN